MKNNMTIYLICALICSMTYEISTTKFETKKNDANITYPDIARSILRVNRESSPSEILNKKNELEGLPRIQFRNIQSNKCLDDEGKNKIGQIYKISTCNKTNVKQWFGFQYPNYKRLDGNFDGYMNIVGHRSKCVSSIYHNGKLTQENCGDSDNLLWRTEKYEKGWIIVSKAGSVMDMAQNGNPVMGMKRTNGPSQIWAINDVQTKEERKVQLKEEQANWPAIPCMINLHSQWYSSNDVKAKMLFCAIAKGKQSKKTCSIEFPIEQGFQDSPKFFENTITSKCICEVSLHSEDWWVDYSINGTKELYPNEKTLKYHKKADIAKIYCRRSVMDGYSTYNSDN